jgi:hypothetical protein
LVSPNTCQIRDAVWTRSFKSGSFSKTDNALTVSNEGSWVFGEVAGYVKTFRGRYFTRFYAKLSKQ